MKVVAHQDESWGYVEIEESTGDEAVEVPNEVVERFRKTQEEFSEAYMAFSRIYGEKVRAIEEAKRWAKHEAERKIHDRQKQLRREASNKQRKEREFNRNCSPSERWAVCSGM